MAEYGEKYFHEYCDIHGDTFRVVLLEKDYTGAPILVECGREQFVISRENSSNLYIGGILPTKATATFLSEEEFDLPFLYTGNEKTYVLMRYKNGAPDWRGNVLADGFSRGNWDDKRGFITVNASDNLPTLKGLMFTDSLGENYGNDGDNVKSFLWAIKEALKKTGFNLNIWTFVDIKSKEQSGSDILYVKLYSFLSDMLVYFQSDLQGAQEFRGKMVPGAVLKVTEDNGTQSTYTVVSSYINSSSGTYSVGIAVNPGYSGLSKNVTLEITPPDTGGSYEDPLLVTNHDVRVWIRDSNVEGKTYYEARGGAMDTWSVLDAIARQWNIVIYQNNNHWEVKRINADKIKSPGGQWFVYNSEGTPLSRTAFGQNEVLACNPSNTRYRIFGTSLDMDRVLRNVIVNYRYKYKQDGDSLKNLINNPNFSQNLTRWGVQKSGAPSDFIPISVNVNDSSGKPNPLHSKVATIANINNGSYLMSRDVTWEADSIKQVNAGDDLEIEFWERIHRFGTGDPWPFETKRGVYQISVWSNQDLTIAEKVFDVILSESKTPVKKNLNGQDVIEQEYVCGWSERVAGQEHTRFSTPFTKGDTGVDLGAWRKIKLTIGNVPINGFLLLEVYGVGRSINSDAYFVPKTKSIENYGRFYTYGIGRSGSGEKFRSGYAIEAGPNNKWQHAYWLSVTGFRLNKIIDSNNAVVPQIDPFMYPGFEDQRTRDYTDTISDVEVLTGDDYGQFTEDRISGMTVSGRPTTMWDTWDNKFGWSRQGLVTAKSIIENYWKPTMLLSCEINVRNLSWSTRFNFEEIPGKRFVILNGSIGGSKSSFKGVLKEIQDDVDTDLPPGGDDGDSTTNPRWESTGVTRCAKDSSGLNTGVLEGVQVDANPASPTYGQERWVDLGVSDTCPIGSTFDIYWGEQSTLDVSGLRTQPYSKNGDVYSVTFSNSDSNVYLVFLHREDLGTIRSISYQGDFESISGWEYRPDVVINGYTYKYIRINWFTGVFSNVVVNFKIN